MLAHLTARALPGTLLFHDWTEALTLWGMLTRAFPEAEAICLMPNHPHIVGPANARSRLSALMSGYARWRGAYRGQDASTWEPQPEPVPLPDEAHTRRTIRYVLLNPCRGGLAADPLAWPLSTHRDLVGLGEPSRRRRDPAAFHAWVSGDPSVAVGGTSLPELANGRTSLAAIEEAVGSVLRLTPPRVRKDERARRLFVRAAWFRELDDAPVLGATLGLHRSSIYRLLGEPPTRAAVLRDPWLHAVLRVVDDPRFSALYGGGPRWSDWRR